MPRRADRYMVTTSPHVRIFLVGTLVLALARTAAAQADPAATRSVLEGVYSEEQARRGEKITNEVCSNCHMEDWFTGSLLESWAGATVEMLYELIRTTMPQDRPSSLERQQYADVLAYIFELNGLPAGQQELSADKEALRAILIEKGSEGRGPTSIFNIQYPISNIEY
ncbi:MAG: c-type cytochrome [Gemmatimonadales bacterium]